MQENIVFPPVYFMAPIDASQEKPCVMSNDLFELPHGTCRTRPVRIDRDEGHDNTHPPMSLLYLNTSPRNILTY